MNRRSETIQDWNNTRAHLQEKFPGLAAADLEYIEGRELELIDRIATRVGQPRESVEKVLRETGAFSPKNTGNTAGYPPAPDVTDKSGIPENTTQSGTSALST
ncbi:MAG: hypothetical protein ACREIA_08365 [Opitutaceae bacterium]